MGGERRLTAGLLAGALLLAPLSARPHEPEAGEPTGRADAVAVGQSQPGGHPARAGLHAAGPPGPAGAPVGVAGARRSARLRLHLLSLRLPADHTADGGAPAAAGPGPPSSRSREAPVRHRRSRARP